MDRHTWQWKGLDRRQLLMAVDRFGQADRQLHMAVEGLDRRTMKHGIGGGWTDGPTTHGSGGG
jgi:hypothetical protein